MSLFLFSDAFKAAFKTFFTSDLDVMSEEVRKILSNPEDAKKYKNAIGEIEKGKSEVTIELSDSTTLTLVS
jgi:hypothetical protein